MLTYALEHRDELQVKGKMWFGIDSKYQGCVVTIITLKRFAQACFSAL